MYVACPSCKAVYQIQAEHLHAARGQVRCSACRNTFSAFEAVFDDPAQALAHAEKQHAERDIEALVSKALEQVPGGEETPEQRQAEVIPAVDEQPAGEAGAESLRPEADYVPKGTQDHEAQLPEQQRAEATPADEEQPVAEAWAESRQPEAAYVPKGTQGDRVKPPLAEAVSGGAEGADYNGSEPQADQPAAPAAEKPVAEAWVAAGSRMIQGVAAAVTPASPAFQADLDFRAQPPAAEFVPRRREPVEPESSVSTVLLLEHEYHDGVSHGTWGAVAASLLLIALLVGQYGYVERYRLAAVPQLRPVLEFGCQLLGCDLPLRHDVGRVEILQREVRDHPQVDDALLIHVTFANQADFVQPYPVFAVSFSDVSGTPVATRRFRPDEYLSDTRNSAGGMQPGERAQLMLEVVDPGPNAVSFQFDFL
jgi:predicted Zn finger-like uncharacterized protein